MNGDRRGFGMSVPLRRAPRDLEQVQPVGAVAPVVPINQAPQRMQAQRANDDPRIEVQASPNNVARTFSSFVPVEGSAAPIGSANVVQAEAAAPPPRVSNTSASASTSSAPSASAPAATRSARAPRSTFAPPTYVDISSSAPFVPPGFGPVGPISIGGETIGAGGGAAKTADPTPATKTDAAPAKKSNLWIWLVVAAAGGVIVWLLVRKKKKKRRA